MSVSIRSCPGCDSLILSGDTYVCPDCGHVFDEEKAAVLAANQELLGAGELMEECRSCGAMVRSGLVKCPDCAAFIREDVAKKHDELQSNPQQIIYSDIPLEERTDYLPARKGADGSSETPVVDAGDDDFVLASPGASPAAPATPAPAGEETGFELGPGTAAAAPAAGTPEQPAQPQPAQPQAAQAAAPSADRTVDAPEEKTKDGAAGASEGSAPAAADDSAASDGDGAAAEAAGTTGEGGGASSRNADIDVDGLLDIARRDEQETRRRKSERRQQARARSILVPCTCGTWIRVKEHQTGRSVRCRKCSRLLPIPQLARKKSEEESATKELSVPWLMDIDFLSVDPSNLRLKPGSLEPLASPADVLISPAGVAICTLGGKGKSGLFGSGGGDSREAARESIREHLRGDGAISAVPGERTEFVPADKAAQITVVQPVQHAHESMFAGVPVFGEGRIAIRIPSDGGAEQQFLSFSLSAFRAFSGYLEKELEVDGLGRDQGVPFEETTETLKCHYSGAELTPLRDATYYEPDPFAELRLVGRKCGACGLAVSEESRKKEKIGGAGGRGLSRAKCPKCGGKFGNNSLYVCEMKPVPDGAKPEGDADARGADAESGGQVSAAS